MIEAISDEALTTSEIEGEMSEQQRISASPGFPHRRPQPTRHSDLRTRWTTLAGEMGIRPKKIPHPNQAITRG
jgi:hypothetical protein